MKQFINIATALLLTALLLFLISGCSDADGPETADDNPAPVSATDIASESDVKDESSAEAPPREAYYAAAGESFKTGDTVIFGSYEQDNDTGNGSEPIEWLVLEVDGDEALLISKYCLDKKVFNDIEKVVGWDVSVLRKWLNGSFYNSAFSAEEQQRIVTSHLVVEANALYGSDDGSDTDDKVFILSYNEAKIYFESDEARATSATAYAKSKIRYKVPDSNGCWWWLRTPGIRNQYVTNVRYDGFAGITGQGVDAPDHCVRPVIRIET